MLSLLVQGISVTTSENNIYCEAAGDIIRKIKKNQSFFKRKIPSSDGMKIFLCNEEQMLDSRVSVDSEKLLRKFLDKEILLSFILALTLVREYPRRGLRGAPRSMNFSPALAAGLQRPSLRVEIIPHFFIVSC